jgi:hypothetical protein
MIFNVTKDVREFNHLGCGTNISVENIYILIDMDSIICEPIYRTVHNKTHTKMQFIKSCVYHLSFKASSVELQPRNSSREFSQHRIAP